MHEYPAATSPRNPPPAEAVTAPVLNGGSPEPARGTPEAAEFRVAVLIVTWNRKSMVESCVRAVAGQTFPSRMLDVVVIDNASTDGTSEHLQRLFSPEQVIQNDTPEAHEPRFVPERGSDPGARNTLGFHSLTIVRNAVNHGGCGGFNTGFAYASELPARPDVLWLVDDDADVAPDALSRLTEALRTHPDAGLVGSRTVDIADRATTIETTIYFDTRTGRMSDHPPHGHRLEADHREFLERSGDVRYRGPYSGVREVDVASACSLLARWDAVVGGVGGNAARGRTPVGFWDARYFIYCDDADWCLRFARAGWKVLLNLDAVVYHTPWHHKLTPARLYYAQRNRVWMCQKVLSGWPLRRVTWRCLWETLYDAAQAAGFRRLFHAEIIRRTAHDAAAGVAGKSAPDSPPLIPIVQALEQAGCFNPGATTAVFLRHHDATPRFEALRSLVAAELHRMGDPRTIDWRVFARNDTPNPPPSSILYAGTWPSRIKKQLTLLRLRPRAIVIFDQTSDLPTITGGTTLHIDARTPTLAQIERDGILPKAAFAIRWLGTLVRCACYAATVRPFHSETRYG